MSITHDADFLRAHDNGKKHAGIVYSHSDRTSLGELIRALILIHAVLDSELMVDHIEFV